MQRVVLMTGLLCAVVSLVSAGVCAADTWYITDVHDAWGGGTSVRLDPTNDRPRIAYKYGSEIRWALRTPSSWAGETVYTVPSGYSVWGALSLALHPTNGGPYIAFGRQSTPSGGGDVWLFWRESPEPGPWWNILVGRGDYSSGRSSSLALDAGGTVHVAYDHHDGLKYAERVFGGFDREFVGTEDGDRTSLALDAFGDPHISYRDAGTLRLKYAHRLSPLNWDVDVVDNTSTVGWGTSLALDAGWPRISYHDADTGSLKYAYAIFSLWFIYTVDNAGEVGEDSSLAIDSAGHAHISYYDVGNGDLKYAAATGTGWDIQTVDTDGSVGRDTSLALDRRGRPHISYWDQTAGKLKYATTRQPDWTPPTVVSATWVNDIQVDVEFSEQMYEPSVEYSWRYAISPSLTVTTAVLQADARTVRLTTAEQAESSTYTVTVSNVEDVVGNLIVPGSGDTAQWTTPSVPPRVLSASYVDPVHVDVEFSEEVYWRTAQDASNYSVSPTLTVDAAVLDPNGTTVHLTTGTQGSDSIYTVTVSNVEDLTGNVVDPAYNQAQWTTLGAVHDLPAAGYYMISFPLIPPWPTPDRLLSDDLGDGAYYMWRWGAGGYQSIPTSAPASQTTTLSIEEGYWILAQGATLDIRGTQPSGDQAIPLQAGWNMVAAPYEASMDSLQVDNGGEVRSLATAQTAGWVLATFYYSHDGTGSYNTLTIDQAPADTLSLWYGYWVLAGVDCSLIVPEPSGGAGAAAIRAAQAAQPQPAWAFDVRARCGNSEDTITIAAADSASDGFDGFALDKPKPPSPPGEGRLRMVLREGWRGTEPPPYNKAPGPQMPWSSELAMETKAIAEDAAEWEFTVTGGVEGDTVTLSWPKLSLLPKDRVAILTDRDTGKRSFMRTRAQYEFSAPGAGSSRSFAVTVKRPQQAGVLISNFSAVPLRGGGAELTFSLSADAAVSIEVVNVAGRLVQRIREGLEVEAGRHMAAWSGRSLSGTALPNGLYLCVLTTKAPDGQQVRRVCPVAVSR